MKGCLCISFLLSFHLGWAQNSYPTKEEFVNSIFHQLVDSNFSYYLLSENAYPCSFKKFDYSEWQKYGLTQEVPFPVLSELSQKITEDTSTGIWQQEKLQQARCLDEKTIRAILVTSNSTKKKWAKPKKEQGAVFFFSKPAFSSDSAYAVIDMGFRCDNFECGMGATYLFKKEGAYWKQVGRKLVWGN